ncbi:hypothetical protein AAG906_023594 [Vitis piasezkii]
MIPGGRNFKEIERKKIGSKSEQKQSENRGKTKLCEISPKENFENGIFLYFSELFAVVKPDFATKVPFARYFAIAKVILTRVPLDKNINFACETHCGFKIERHSRSCSSSSLSLTASLRSSSPINLPNLTTRNGANTRAKSSSPSSRKQSLRRSQFRSRSSLRSQEQFLLRSEPIDLTEQSPASRYLLRYPRRFHLRYFASRGAISVQAKSQEPQAPLPEPQIPAEIAPEEVIRRPMLTQPPIEGNLDCRARPFHSELCFDIAAFQVRPELTQSFNLLRRHHMEHLLTPRDFFYPRIAMDFYQSMTTNQLKPCKFPMSQPNSIILELGPILLSWRWCKPFPRSQNRSHLLRGSFLQSCFD